MSSDAPSVCALRIEHRDALGIGIAEPRISWRTETAHRGWRQARYEIEVDGVVHAREGGDSVLVAWPAAPLKSRQRSSVRVRVDAVPDRELTGTLKDISVVAKPDFSSWSPVRNFDVVVAIADSDPRLRSGMSAAARVELDRLAGVLVVPTGAVFQRGSATIVYVVERGGTVNRPVTILRRGRDQVAIASGVREGERVALREPAQEGASK